MHEGALMAINLGKGERILAPSDGHQQSRRSAAVFMREQGVASAIGELQLCGSDDRGGDFLFVTTGGYALSSATVFCYRTPQGHLRWSQSRLIPGGRIRASLSFRWSPWDPDGDMRADPARRGCPPYL